MDADGAPTIGAEGVLEIAAAVRTREVSATEVIEAHLAAAHASQPHLNAFTLIDDDGARRAAAAIDRRIAAREPVGPLAGVPVGIKDLIDQAGHPTTNGGSFEPARPHGQPSISS